MPDTQSDAALSFRWYGQVQDSGWLGVTVADNVLRGTLVTVEQSYQIFGSPDSGFILAEIDPGRLPPAHGSKLMDRAQKLTTQQLNDLPYARIARPFPTSSQTIQSGNPVRLDLLIMYTAQAQIDAGGPAGLNALIQQSIDNTNQAFINSGYPSLSVREVHRQLLTGFVPSGTTAEDARFDRDRLRVDSQITTARDAHYADVTMVLLRDVFDAAGALQLFACGSAYVQSPTCGDAGAYPQCGVGASFEDYAISWVSTECATLPGRNTFPHELGHLMGAEHQPGGPPISQDPADASFVWSYANFRRFGTPFGTLMWIPTQQTGQLPQPLNFSDPDVFIGTIPSGIAGQRDNIRTFEALAPIMEQFRIPPEKLIFADRFE